METDYKGSIKYEERSFEFTFIGHILYVFVDQEFVNELSLKKKEEGKHITSYKAPLPFSSWIGIENKEGRKICFSFDPSHYAMTQAFGVYLLMITVTDFMDSIGTAEINPDSTSIHFYSKQYSCFLDISFADMKKDNKQVPFESLKQIGFFKIDGNDCCLSPIYRQDGENEITSGICLYVHKVLSHEETLELSRVLLTFLQFCFYRMDVYPEQAFYNVSKEVGMISFVNPFQDKKIENGINTGYLPWKSIYQISGNIISAIIDKEIYLGHIEDDSFKRFRVFTYAISQDAAAFENEFRRSYPNGLSHSEDGLKLKKEIEDELDEHIKASHSKKKDIYKYLKKCIHNDTLGDRIAFALKDNEKSITYLKEMYAPEQNEKEIAKECSLFRNDVDHGNDIFGINNRTTKDFLVLRGLIYAMQLRRFGLDDETIDKCVGNLLSFDWNNIKI